MRAPRAPKGRSARAADRLAAATLPDSVRRCARQLLTRRPRAKNTPPPARTHARCAETDGQSASRAADKMRAGARGRLRIRRASYALAPVRAVRARRAAPPTEGMDMPGARSRERPDARMCSRELRQTGGRWRGGVAGGRPMRSCVSTGGRGASAARDSRESAKMGRESDGRVCGSSFTMQANSRCLKSFLAVQLAIASRSGSQPDCPSAVAVTLLACFVVCHLIL